MRKLTKQRRSRIFKGLTLAVSILFYGTLFAYSGYTDLFAHHATQASATAAVSTPAPAPKVAPVVSTLTPTQAAAKAAQGYGLKRVAIALQEYRGTVIEANHNCNCGPEINVYTQNHPQQWCTDFASWVTMEAGDPVWSTQNKSWRINNSHDMMNYLKAHGTWYDKKTVQAKHLTPQPGDFIIYYRGNPSDRLGHTSIVVGAGSKPGTVDALDANIQDTIVYSTSYDYLNYAGFLGFGRP